MEEISTLIWLGIAVLWFLTRMVRRGARKSTGGDRRPRPKSPPRRAAPAGEARPETPGGSADFSGRGGTGPPPIVPR